MTPHPKLIFAGVLVAFIAAIVAWTYAYMTGQFSGYDALVAFTLPWGTGWLAWDSWRRLK